MALNRRSYCNPSDWASQHAKQLVISAYLGSLTLSISSGVSAELRNIRKKILKHSQIVTQKPRPVSYVRRTSDHMCTAGWTSEGLTKFLSCEALPDVLLHLWPLDVSTCACLVGDGHRRVSWLTELWLFFRCIEVLRHALVHDLVIENVHDLGKRLACHICTVDGLHNPATLDACCESLALRVSGVARLRNDLHDH